ncbi:MAG TPA: glucose-1-phosphate adenylyltransferase [Holophagaceae bacterium]|nr:glucose-1-phosphate adenylyltransferase [Holophagaceae bacterium]
MALQETFLTPRHTITIVLAGGRGERLKGLTERESKPGLDFGGQFKIIDFTLSNCVNSGFRRVMVLTQYNAHRLLEHLQKGWGFLNGPLGEFIQPYPAEQGPGHDSWYKGTGDAVYRNLHHVMAHSPRNVLVLAGDHVYRMDYKAFLQDHLAADADLTIACMEVPSAEASAFGVVQVDARNRITGFFEKPADPPALPGAPDRALISMGIYFFKAGFLYDVLKGDAPDAHSSHDFGKDLIPAMVAKGATVVAHRFEHSQVAAGPGPLYWRDVGTLDAFWKANLDLTREESPLDLHDEAWPIYTHLGQLPPAKLMHTDLGPSLGGYESLVASGCVLDGATVRGSLLSTKVTMHHASEVEESVLLPGAEVGEGARLRRVLVGRGCRIPRGMVVGEDPEMDARRFYQTPGGITLITQGPLMALEAGA